MQYVNLVYGNTDAPTLHAAPVPSREADYLRLATLHLKPLSDEEYMTGPAAILHTAAKYSYVLDGEALFWCIEWDPGLIVIKIAPETDLQWVALRSPNPHFGGREPLAEDGDADAYDMDDNPQYELIFTPWDAQFDEDDRDWASFVPADIEVQARFESALNRVNALSRIMETRFGRDRRHWISLCQSNLERWAGDGVRLKAAR